MTDVSPQQVTTCCSTKYAGGRGAHADDCDLLAERVNRVAACRSIVLGGITQNPELMLTDFTRDA